MYGKRTAVLTNSFSPPSSMLCRSIYSGGQHPGLAALSQVRIRRYEPDKSRPPETIVVVWYELNRQAVRARYVLCTALISSPM